MQKISKLIITIIFLVEYVVHGLFYPFVILLLPFYGPLRKRFKAELKFNKVQLQLSTDYCFEVSSEGEYEQIASVMMYLLKSDIKVQLIIASESLIKKADQLNQQYGHLDVRMVPLASFFWINLPFSSNLYSLIKAQNLILCRYDFFPELMLLGGLGNRKFSLVSASLKCKKLTGVNKIYWQGVYSLFDLVVPASKLEESHIRKLLPAFQSESFDFRQLQIISRIENCQDILNNWKHFSYFHEKLQLFPKRKRVIFGSCWEEECLAFSNQNFINDLLNGTLFLVIAPHNINIEYIEMLITKIQSYHSDLIINVINDKTTPVSKAHVHIIQKSGILVELYSFFGHCFVGGGYGRSIHSVLEPFMSECLVYCGPKTHRSTEFDLIQAQHKERVIVVEQAAHFYNNLQEKIAAEINTVIINRDDLNKSFKWQLSRLIEGP